MKLGSIIPFIVAILFATCTPVLAEDLEDSAHALRNQGKWQEALTVYSSLTAKDSKHEASLCLNKAICYGHLGQFDQKLENCNKALNLYPQNASFLAVRADCYIHMGEGKKALEDCNKGLAFKPNDATLYCNRGEAQYLLGNYEQAIADLSKAIELMPNFGEAFHYRALANEKDGKNKEADADKQKAREMGYKPGLSSLIIKDQVTKQ